jgi:hypothetical protein
MFGRKQKHEKHEERDDEAKAETVDADAIMKQALNTLDRSLAIKREAREKTARFVGSLRPLAKAR